MTFRNHERICIPLQSQEMALKLQKAVGKIVSVLRTDIPDHEFFYFIHDEPHEDSKKTTKEARIPNTEEDTDGAIIKEPASFVDNDSEIVKSINTTDSCVEIKNNDTTSSDNCLVGVKVGQKKRFLRHRKKIKGCYKNNLEYISKTQRTLFTDDCTGGKTDQC